jgi:aryl-phospho-beta-D-glucosidase BglC (GH1 family)
MAISPRLLSVFALALLANCSKTTATSSGASSSEGGGGQSSINSSGSGGSSSAGSSSRSSSPSGGSSSTASSAGGSGGGGVGGTSAGGQDTGGVGGSAAGQTSSSSAGGSSTGGTVSVDAAAPVDASPSGEAGTTPPGNGTYLHVEGTKLVDAKGTPARFTGVNWFGFETAQKAPHGLWSRDYRSMLKQIRDLGFNSVRVPYSNAIMRSDAVAKDVETVGVDAYDKTDPINADLKGKSPLEMMDRIIAVAGELGLRIILDNHSREPDGYMNEPLWYTDKVSEQQWITDWTTLAKRYAGNPTVAAADLDNEPFGKATWGAGNKDTDWNSAAEKCGNAILAVNPDILIIVEGVSIVGTDTYWWGGNLSGVRTSPIKLNKPDKLVYSAHEYGPEVHDQDWFTAASFPSNLADVWDKHFSFIMKEGLGHILIGEFGLKDRTYSGGKTGVWFETLLKLMGSSYSWTFWCWNPNSGDTEGILKYDWVSTQEWKITALKPLMAPLIGQ